MEIKKEEFYVIVKFDKNNIIEYFNNRIYIGKYVMLAYNQITNKEEYTICSIKCKPLA